MKPVTFLRAGLASLSIVLAFNAFGSDVVSRPDEVSFQFPALLTACQVEKGDKYFPDAPTLVLAFVVKSGYSVLYKHKGKEDIFLAEMHYDEGGLDAQGGVWSEFRAEDVYNYLSKKEFYLIPSKKEYQSGNYFRKLQPCKIEYQYLKKYEQGM